MNRKIRHSSCVNMYQHSTLPHMCIAWNTCTSKGTGKFFDPKYICFIIFCFLDSIAQFLFFYLYQISPILCDAALNNLNKFICGTKNAQQNFLQICHQSKQVTLLNLNSLSKEKKNRLSTVVIMNVCVNS